MEPSDTLIITGQQDFELFHQLNPIEIKIDNDKFINSIKKYKKALHKFTAMGLLFPLSIINDTNQMFVTCRKLNKAKMALINSKILSILGVINLDKISNWIKIKGKSIWINENFEELKDFSFNFETTNLADLLSFSIYLIDSNNNKITFNDGEKKLLNFKTDIYQ